MATPYDAYLYPSVSLRVNGKPADDITERMTSFEFHDHLKKVDMAKFHLTDVEGEFSNDPRFESDTPWEFRWGYPTDMSSPRTMLLKFWEPRYTERGEVEITVTLMGGGAEMLRVESAKNWGKIATSEVAKRMAKRHKLKFKIENSNDKDVPIIQPNGVSDFLFLHQLADRIDYEFFVDNGTLYFRSKDTSRGEEPRLSFVYGGVGVPTLLKSFEPVIKVTKKGKVKGLAADTGKGRKNPEVTTSSTKNPLGKTMGAPPTEPKNPVDADARVSTSAKTQTLVKGGRRRFDLISGNLIAIEGDQANKTVTTPETAPAKVKKLVQAHRRDALERAVEARATMIGTPRIRAKATFTFAGIDRRLAGVWYIKEAVHKIAAKAYEVSCELHKGAYSKGTSKVPSKESANTATGVNAAGTRGQAKVQVNLVNQAGINQNDDRKLLAQLREKGRSPQGRQYAVPDK